jgi:hypothetical protein
MRKGVLIIFVLTLLVFSLAFITPEDDELPEDTELSAEELAAAEEAAAAAEAALEGADKAFSCLANSVEGKCSELTFQERVFTVLTLGECKEELIADSNNEECWPKARCNVKDTALAIWALDERGENTEKAENWLFYQNTTSSDVSWFLEIDAAEETTCTISYSGIDYSIEINEDKTISSDAGSCLSKTSSGYWLEVSPACYTKKFETSCDSDFLTTLLYTREGSSVIHVSENTQSSSSGGETEEGVSAFCFANMGTCDYEGSLWASVVLDSRTSSNYDLSPYYPYLITIADQNREFLPEMFLYLLLGHEDFRNDLLLKQGSSGYWDESGNKFYDTAIALLPFSWSSIQEMQNSRDWLLGIQDDTGCFNNNNKRDTAILLYSLWLEKVPENQVVITEDPPETCTDASCEPQECNEDTGQCVDPPELCVDDTTCDSPQTCDIATGLCIDTVDLCAEVICDSPQTCNDATGECVDPTELCAEVICDSPQVCDSTTGECVGPVDLCAEVICDSPQVCDLTTGECIEQAGPCIDDIDCTSPQICDENTWLCVDPPEPCTDDMNCTSPQTCDITSGLCIDQTETCIDNSDCTSPKTCNSVSGLCETPDDDETDCESTGRFCMSGGSCATENIVTGYSCAGLFKCCSVQEEEETCDSVLGDICNSNEICKGSNARTDNSVSDVLYGESCCIGGVCEVASSGGGSNDQNTCEENSHICRSSGCRTGEEEVSYETCDFTSETCCKDTSSGGGTNNYLWLWIVLILLIILLVIAIIFRDKLRPYWHRMTGSKKDGPGKGRLPRRPSSSFGKPMGSERPRRMAPGRIPPANRPMQRRPVQTRPVQKRTPPMRRPASKITPRAKPRPELNNTLDKLRDISKK